MDEEDPLPTKSREEIVMVVIALITLYHCIFHHFLQII